MRRYDEDYVSLVKKLNNAFAESQNSKVDSLEAFARMNGEKQKLVDDMPYEEIRKISFKVHSKITDINYLTQDEEMLVKAVQSGRKNKYKQVVYRLVGNIDIGQIMERYTEFLQSEEVFQTFYLYEGLENPVKVVCENRDNVFPIHDIRSLSQDKQTFLVKNVLAAEMRRTFNIEKDHVLRMQGYLTNFNEMIVIISLYPHMSYGTGIQGILYKIFPEMETENSNLPIVDEKTAQKMSDQVKSKSIAYWKKLMLPLSKSMTIPGECIKTEESDKKVWGKCFLYRELGEKLTGSVNAFCQKNQVSVKAVLLYAWGKLMGRYHNEKNPLMAVAQSGSNMDVFPVKIAEKDLENCENLQDIDRQLKEAPNYSECTIHDVEEEIGTSFSEYFRMVHNFIEFSELDDIGAGKSEVKSINGISSDDTDINLFISYHLYDDTIGINYVSKGGIIEVILENLHELLLDELSIMLSANNEVFDKKSFIKVSDTDEEKLYKIQLAQIGLYLKESGIFDSLTVDEIMKLAEYCKLTTYLSNDTLVAEGSGNSSIYIVGDGKIEESMTASDGMVKTLRIANKGTVFGLESLFPAGEAKTTYTVASTQAKLVEINQEILTEIFRRKSEGWVALLEKEMKQKFSLQRLWTMD